MTKTRITLLALESGFMLSTQHGQGTNKAMPVSDTATLEVFTRAITAEMTQVLDQIAEMLGVEPGDVDGIAEAVERLKRFQPYFDMTFDSWAVYSELTDKAKSCTGPENVSYVLDALNKAAKKALAGGGGE
jgi:hypothetical protein